MAIRIILCDVLPMDVCHTLRGRQWKFDIKAFHDGEKNSYSFKKNGITYKIESLIDGEEVKPTGPSVFLVGEKGFLNTLKEGEGVRFSLVLKPKEEKKIDIKHRSLQKYKPC